MSELKSIFKKNHTPKFKMVEMENLEKYIWKVNEPVLIKK